MMNSSQFSLLCFFLFFYTFPKQATSSSSPYGIFPGTYWCGLGNSAPDKARLGISPFVDRCCRIHDQCPLWILKLESRYGLFNSRFHTVSHCHCDEAFRNCLQMEGSETAIMVGEMFFNQLASPCFVLENGQVCEERTWWGYCKKYSQTKVGKWKNHIPFERTT
uniref:Phospholipase A2-like central domain-containing protein n=1 Tax=Lepeophtheirus salmonis TaxID=72036 RepID=A0A0K2TM74_LEPSM